jgi:cell volume regulation protein A
MAYMLTIILIQLFSAPEINSWHIITTFLLQLILGTLSGFFIGTFAVRIINKINLNNDALYSVLLLAVMFFLLGFTDVIGGNGYLAVYLGGLIIGNHRFVHKRSTQKFFDGLTWLAQIIIFLALGLLVNPSELLPIAVIGSAVGLFLIFAARPAAVFLSLLPFRKMTVRARTFVSWVGLRGAVPIIFATYPLVAEVPHAREMFNVVFFITIMSLIIQGMQIPNVGKWLKLSSPAPEKHKFNHFDVENFSDEMKSAMREIVVTQNMLSHGNRLMDMNMPENALVAMVKRNEIYFIPRGNTHLEPHDLILVIADSDEKMKETLDSLNNK